MFQHITLQRNVLHCFLWYVVADVKLAMLGRLARQLVCRRLVSFRNLSTTGHVLSVPHDISEKDFHPRKALLIRKVTRYEYEKLYLQPNLSEEELKESVRKFLFSIKCFSDCGCVLEIIICVIINEITCPGLVLWVD